jgi:hypothetical protein
MTTILMPNEKYGRRNNDSGNMTELWTTTSTIYSIE